MIKENYNLKNAIKEYLKLLDETLYFKAHETLEEAWHPLRKKKHPLTNLVKGLINGAIAFEHIKRDRKNAKRKASQVIKSFDRHKSLAVEGIEFFELFKESCEKVESLKKELKII